MEPHSFSSSNFDCEVDSSSFFDPNDHLISKYSLCDYHYDPPTQKSYSEATPTNFLMEPFDDHFLLDSTIVDEQSPHMTQGCNGDTSTEIPNSSEVAVVEDNEEDVSNKKEIKRKRCDPSVLNRELISTYFHMLVRQAANELRVGQTLLKRKCREAGISRWPHRRLKSLETLMQDVQDSEEGTEKTETKASIEALKDRYKLKKRLVRTTSSLNPTSSSCVPIYAATVGATVGSKVDEKDTEILPEW